MLEGGMVKKSQYSNVPLFQYSIFFFWAAGDDHLRGAQQFVSIFFFWAAGDDHLRGAQQFVAQQVAAAHLFKNRFSRLVRRHMQDGFVAMRVKRLAKGIYGGDVEFFQNVEKLVINDPEAFGDGAVGLVSFRAFEAHFEMVYNRQHFQKQRFLPRF